MLIGRETVERLEAAGEVLRVEEVREVAAELFVAVVVAPFDGRVLDRPVHPLNLAVLGGFDPLDQILIPQTPRMVGLGQSVLDPVRNKELEGTVAPVGPRKPRKRRTALAER